MGNIVGMERGVGWGRDKDGKWSWEGEGEGIWGRVGSREERIGIKWGMLSREGELMEVGFGSEGEGCRD